MARPALLSPSTSSTSFHSFHQHSTISPPLSPLVSPFTTTSTTALAATRLSASATDLTTSIAPPSSLSLPWIWQCHICRARWPLGATRRCLIDGHYYCSGQSPTRRSKAKAKAKRGRSCSSEFDYIGWKDWSLWKRQLRDGSEPAVGCSETCEFPSHCRYRKAGARGPKPAIEANHVFESGASRAERGGGLTKEMVKVKTLEEILQETEAEEKEEVVGKEDKKGKWSKSKRKKIALELLMAISPSDAKETGRAKEKERERGNSRSQSISPGSSSAERLHRLREVTERRIERSRSESESAGGVDRHDQEDKTEGEKTDERPTVESGLQPFFSPVIEFLNRKVTGGTVEDKN